MLQSRPSTQINRCAPTRPGGRAPLFSEHTREVITKLAGVSDEEYEELRAAEVVDAHPTGLDLR